MSVEEVGVTDNFLVIKLMEVCYFCVHVSWLHGLFMLQRHVAWNLCIHSCYWVF